MLAGCRRRCRSPDERGSLRHQRGAWRSQHERGRSRACRSVSARGFLSGLGQRKVAECIGFCLTHSGPITEELVIEFTKFAVARGYSDAAADFCWDLAAKLAGGEPVAQDATPAPAERKSAAAERSEIEALMGAPNSEYWRGPKAATLQQRYRELLAAAAG